MSIFIIIVIVHADAAQFYGNHNHIAQLYGYSDNQCIRNVYASRN